MEVLSQCLTPMQFRLDANVPGSHLTSVACDENARMPTAVSNCASEVTRVQRGNSEGEEDIVTAYICA
jgi:hypothetical protein